MSKSIKLNMNDIRRLNEWIEVHAHDELSEFIELVEDSSSGIGTTITAYRHDKDRSGGIFKIITDFSDW